jgi:hypothetical protein
VLNQLRITPWRPMGSRCIDPHFLDLGSSWRWVVSFTPWPLYPRGKSPRYLLDRRLGGPQSRSGHGETRYSYVQFISVCWLRVFKTLHVLVIQDRLQGVYHIKQNFIIYIYMYISEPKMSYERLKLISC